MLHISKDANNLFFSTEKAYFTDLGMLNYLQCQENNYSLFSAPAYAEGKLVQ